MQRMSLPIIRFGDVGRRPCAPISCILVSILPRELLHLSKAATVSTGQFIKSKKKKYDFSVFYLVGHTFLFPSSVLSPVSSAKINGGSLNSNSCIFRLSPGFDKSFFLSYISYSINIIRRGP